MAVRIFSTDTDAGSLSVIDRSDNNEFTQLCEIPIGNAPRGSVKFTKDVRGYVSNCGGDTISEIDLLTNRETARIKVGVAPRGIGIVPGDRFALVSNSGANYLSVVNLGSRKEIFQVAVGRDPRHMAISRNGHSAYVAIWGSHYVGKIDIRALEEGKFEDIPRDVREVARIPVGDGAHPYSLALDPQDKYAYVANTQAPYISVINTNSDQVEAQIDVGTKGSRAIAFSPDGRHAYASIEDTSEVVAIDTKTREVAVRWDVGPGPRGIALEPKSLTLYASAFSRKEAKATPAFTFLPNTLTVIDLSHCTDLKADRPDYDQIPVGAGPCSVAVLDLAELKG